MRGKLLNIKNLLLAICIVGSIFYAPHASGQAATMTTNITTVCAGSASPIIKFTYTGTGNEGSAPYTFTYKINDGTDVTVTTVTGDTVSIFVPTNNAGSYKYSLVSVAGSSATGPVTSSEITFTINSAPTVPVVTGTTTLCVGGTSRLSSVTSGGSWSSSDETIATVESDGDVIAQSAGQVAIYYTVTDANGCSSTKITTVTVYPIPTIEQITGTADVCVGNTTTFTTATTGGTWTSSTTSVATINSSGVITGVSAGTATITYNYTNSQTSCSASATKIVTVLAVPTVADIAGTFTVCKDVTTTLTNSTAGGVWSSNLTNIATVDPSTGVVTGVSAGTATISYTVTGVNGCTKSAMQAVVVSAPTVNPISVTATTLCVGGTITATSTTSSGTWTTTNAGVTTINSSGVVTGVAAGTASIVYTVSSGGCSNSATIGITVLTQPAPTFSFTDNPCSGSSVGFTSSVTGAGTYSYTWDFGDGTSSTQQNPSHIFTSLGCGTATFNVTLTVTDANGCSNSVVNTITVKQQANVDYEDVQNPYTQFDNCGLPVPSSAYEIRIDKAAGFSNCITSYTVDWGDGSGVSANIQLPLSHTYTSAGTFNLIVTAIGSNGCNISKTIVVKNVGNPSGGIVNPGSTTNLCAPTAPIALAISNWVNNAAGTRYEVNYGDGTIVTYTQEQMVASHYYATSSNYPIPHSYDITSCPSSSIPVTLTISNSCGSTIGSTTIGPILAKPVANFTAVLKTCVGSSVAYTNTTVAGYNQSCSRLTNYTWNFGDGTPNVTTGNIPSPLNRTHTFTAAGTYSVTLTTTSYCGVSTKVQTICVEPTVLTPAFSLDTEEGCGPLTVNATNGTGASNSCPSPPTNLWEVTYASGFCGSGNGSWSFSGGTSSSSENPVFNFVTPGTYTIKLTVTNSCGSASITKTVKVKQPPTVSLATIDNFCNSSSLTPSATVASCAPNTSTLTYAWTFTGASPSSSSSATPSGLTYATPGTYSISLSVSNECGTSSATSNTFTVLPNGQVNQPDNQVVCNGAATNAVSFSTTNVGGTTTYAWSNNTTSIGLGASGTGKINSFFGVNTGSSPVIGTITVTPTYTSGLVSCVGSSKQFTIQVNNVAAGSIGFSQTICNGADPSLIFNVSSGTGAGSVTYQWQSSTNNSSWSNISGANGSSYDPPSGLTTSTYYRRITLSTLNGYNCNSVPSNVVLVTVQSVPVNGSIAADQTICSGGDPVAFSSSAGGSGSGIIAYQWQASTTSSSTGFLNISGANSATYDVPSGLTATTYYKRLTRSTQNGYACFSTGTNVVTVTVIQDPTITSQPTGVTQCVGGNTSISVTATGGTPSLAYQWYSNASNANTGGSIISGATSSSYTPPSLSAGTIYYYCIVSATGNGCTSTTTNAVAVVNIVDPSISSQPTAITECIGGTTALSITASGGTPGLTYQWYSNASNSNSGGISIGGATSSSYTPPSTSAGTTYYYCVVSASGNGCASVTSSVVAVVIVADPAISQQPTAITQCIGGNAQLSVTATGGTPGLTYQWYSNTNNANTGGSSILNATSSTYTPPSTSAGTIYYYCVVSASGNGCNPVTSDVVAVTILADPSISSQPIGFTECIDGTRSLSVTATGGTPSLTYQWYSNNSNSTSGSTLIGSATNATYTPPSSSAGTKYYYCVVSASGNGCTSVTSSIVLVTVVADPTITVQPTAITQCIGGTSALSVTATGGTPSLTYQWFSNVSNSNSGGSVVTGATSSTYTPSSLVAGTVYYYCVVSASGDGCASATSNAVAVIVQTTPTAGTIGSDQTICYNGDPAAFTSTSDGTGDGSITYIWQSSLNNSSWSPISNATSATYDPPSGLIATTYYRRITVSTLNTVTCQSVASNVVIVIVQSVPTAGTIAASQTICNGGNPAAFTSSLDGTGAGTITYIWQSSLNNSTFSDIASATASTYDVPNGLTATTYYRRITVSTLNGVACQSVASNVLTVTVQSVPTAGSIAASQTICYNGDPAAFTSVAGSGSGAITYIWQSSTDNNNFSTIANENAATYNPPSGLTVTTYYRRITVSTLNSVACQSVASNVLTVTVQSVPTAGTITADQTICSGGDPAAFASSTDGTGVGSITYIWQSSLNNSSWSDISSATSSSYDVPSGLTATTYYRRVTVSTLNSVTCQSIASNVITVTVQTVPTAGIIATAQTICYNGNPAAFTSPTNGTGVGAISYKWQSSTDNSSFTDIAGETASTYDAPGGLTVTTYYRRITVSTLNGVACLSVPTTSIAVTVQTVPTAGVIATAQTICYNGDPAAFTSTTNGTGSGAITYIWQSSTDNNNFSTIVSANLATYDPPTGLTVTTYYRRITVSTLNTVACQSVPSNVITVAVQSIPTAGSIAANQTICNSGDPAAFTSSTDGTGDGAITYIWQSSTDNTNFSNISGATNATYDAPTGLTVTTYYRRITVSTLNSIACQSVPTSSIVVIVNNVTAGTITANQTICYGGDPAAFTSTGVGSAPVGATITYKWQSSANNISFADISGAILAAYDPPSNLTATTYYRRITVSTLSGVVCESVPTSVITVTVQSVPTAGSIGSDQTICYSGNPAAFTSSSDGTGDGLISYIWQSSTDNTNFSTITGANLATYDAPTGLTATTYYRRITVSTLNTVACQSIPSNVVTVIVQTVPTAGTIAASQTICNGGNPAAFTSSADGTGAGTITYIWQSSLNNSTFSDIASATASTYDVPNGLTATTYYRRITVSTLNGVACQSVASNVLTVTVQSVPTAGSIAASQTICYNGDPAAFTSVAGTGNAGATITYIWQSSTDNNNFSTIPSANADIYNPPSGLTVTTYYRRITVATLNSIACQSVPTNVLTVTVQSVPTAGSIGSDQTICSGGNPDAFTSITAASGDGAITYVWQSSTDNNTYTNISLATSATYDAPSGLTTTTYYRRVATSTLNGNACAVNSSPVLVTVNPIPSVNTISNQAVCVDQQFSAITFSGAVNSTVYNWTNNNTNTGLAASGTGNIAAFTATNLTNAAIVSTITVTPIYTYNSVSCTGSTKSFTLTVNPKATIANKTASSCSGTGFTVTPSNGGGDIVPSGTTYAWSAPTVTGSLTGGALATGQSSISGTLTNPTNIPQTATYTVTPTSGTCTGPTFTVVATINPKPVIANKTPSICSGEAFTVSPSNGSDIVPSNTTYTWTVVDNASVTGESNQATGQSSISQTLTNNTNTAKTVVYTVTPTSGDAGSCVGAPFTVTVTVNPTPVVPNQTATICSGGTFTKTPVDAAPTTIIPSGTTYTWTVAPNADVTGETDQAVGQSSISQTLTNTSNTVQTVVYTVTPKSGTTGACVGATFTVTVTVNPRPTVDAISNQAVCAGSTVSGVTITGSVASTVYTWANNTTSIGLGASGTGNITSFTGTNVTNLSVVATVTVTPTYTNNSVACVGSTSTFTITINPRPVIANKTATICSGAAFTIAPSNSGSEIVPASTTYT